MFCEDCTGGAGHYGGGRTGGTGPSRGGGTSGTPTSTPPGCYSVVCLPTSTPTHTPTDTPRPGPGYYPTTPTPTPTPTATPWPYTRTPGRVNVPDLYWGTAYALTVSLPKAVGNPTILHAVGRGAPETLGGPISAMVGLAVSVYPNEIRHVTQGDSVRETVTDVIVDTGGYAFSTVVGTGGAAVFFGFSMTLTQGQLEIAAPVAMLGDAVFSVGASLLWDLWASPNYVRPFVYQHLPD